MTNTQFNAYYPRYVNMIHAIARKYAGADADLFDDLCSCGAIGLLEADLRRPVQERRRVSSGM
jgi:DNA-directed RNA polymerase specialized sigma subunit